MTGDNDRMLAIEARLIEGRRLPQDIRWLIKRVRELGSMLTLANDVCIALDVQAPCEHGEACACEDHRKDYLETCMSMWRRVFKR